MANYDQNVLHTLYNKLFDAITYSPTSSRATPFDRNSSMIQFSSNMAIRKNDFINAFSPINPNGDMRTAEMFSRLVDAVPEPQVQFVDSGKKISDIYHSIVVGANSSAQVDPKQEKLYEMAYSYLNSLQILKDFMGNETRQVIDSPIYAKYKINIQSYIAALSSYRLTYNNYDLTQVAQQKDWQAKEPVLKAAIDAAWNNLQQGGAPLVEQALATLSTSINSSIRSTIAREQSVMASAGLASMAGSLPPWYLAYSTPSDWMSTSALQNMTQIVISSGQLEQTADSSFTKWSAKTSGAWGLWSFGGSASSSSGKTTSHMESRSFKMSANVGVVRIYRPWFNPALLQMQNWFVDSTSRGGISDANGRGLLPMYSTALIVARNFRLEGSFSSQDKSHVEKSISTEARGGWGPFQIGGSYSHSESHDRVQSSFDGTTLSVPGMQIIGFVNAVTPMCPPQDAPK